MLGFGLALRLLVSSSSIGDDDLDVSDESRFSDGRSFCVFYKRKEKSGSVGDSLVYPTSVLGVGV